MAGNYAASSGHPDIFKMLQPLQEIPYLPDYLIRAAGMGNEYPVTVRRQQVVTHILHILHDDLILGASVFPPGGHFSLADLNPGLQVQLPAKQGCYSGTSSPIAR